MVRLNNVMVGMSIAIILLFCVFIFKNLWFLGIDLAWVFLYFGILMQEDIDMAGFEVWNKLIGRKDE